VACGSRPVPSPTACLSGLGEKGAERDAIGTAGKGLGDGPGVIEFRIRNDVHVATFGLVEVVTAGRGGIGNGGGHGGIDADGFRVGRHARAHDDAGRPCAH